MADTQTPAPKAPVRKPEEEVTAIKVVAAFKALDEVALLQVFISSQTANSGRYANATEALAAMGRARKITAASLEKAVNLTTGQLNSVIKKLWDDFMSATWDGPVNAQPTFDASAFEAKFAEKKDQCSKWRDFAIKIRSQAHDAAGKFGIKTSELDSNPVLEMARKVAYKHPDRPLNWKTPPALTEQDDDVKALTIDFAQVFAGGHTGQTAIDELGALYNRHSIVELLAGLIKKCDQQIAESDSISQFVENDYNTRFQPVLERAADLSGVLQNVRTFYSIAKPAAAVPAPTRRR